MTNIGRFLLAILVFTFLPLKVQGETTRTKTDILRISDFLFGERYKPIPGKSLIHNNDKKSILYRRGSDYVIRLTFSSKGELIGIQLFPEALLYSDNWNDVPQGVELTSSERQWMLDKANKLRPVGDAILSDFCFESGANLYCSDFYKLATVFHQWRNEYESDEKKVLKKVAIDYDSQVRKIGKVPGYDKKTLDLK